MDTQLASCTDAAALAAAIAHRYPQARQHGDQWQVCCPAHDDHTPSLSITPAADKVLLYCHAQCSLDAILAALGLTRRALFVHGAAPRNGHRHIVQVYDYVDAAGVLVHQTVRLTPKAFRQRRPDPKNPGGWIWNLEGVEPVLYHLPRVLEAIQARCPLRQSCTSPFLGAPGSSPAPEATLERGVPRKSPRGLAGYLCNTHLALAPPDLELCTTGRDAARLACSFRVPDSR